MKITGAAGDQELKVSGAKPKTTYIVRFQDTGSGRLYVTDAITDDSGNAVIPPPVGWALSGFKLSAHIVGEKDVISYTNVWNDDGSLSATSIEAVASAPAFTPSPDITDPANLGGN